MGVTRACQLGKCNVQDQLLYCLCSFIDWINQKMSGSSGGSGGSGGSGKVIFTLAYIYVKQQLPVYFDFYCIHCS